MYIAIPIFLLHNVRGISGGEHAGEVEEGDVRLAVVVEGELEMRQLREKRKILNRK